MADRSKSFPWSNENGLCKVLRDPKLWEVIFDTPDLRRTVKNAARRARIGKLPNVQDSVGVSDALIKLLCFPNGRAEVNKGLEDFGTSLGDAIYFWYLTDHSNCLPTLEKVRDESSRKLALAPAKFANWLRENQFSGDDFRVVSLFGCAFAIIQPRDGRAIFEALYNNNGYFHEWILDEVSRSDEVSNEIDNSLKKTEQVPRPTVIEPKSTSEVPTRSEPETVVLVPELKDILSFLQDGPDAVKSFSAARLRRVVAELAKLQENIGQPLNRLSAAQMQAKMQMDNATRILWAQIVPSESGSPTPSDGEAVYKEIERLTLLADKCAQLIQANEELSELLSRCGEQIASLPLQRGTLEELIALAEQKNVILQQKLETLNEQQSTATGFIEAFAATDEQSGPPLLANIATDEWSDITAVILGRIPKPLQSAAFLKLNGRFDIAGLIISCLWKSDSRGAIKTAKLFTLTNTEEYTLPSFEKTLSYLTFGQMHELVQAYPLLADPIAELIFATALKFNRFDALDYLDPLLNSPSMPSSCKAFYQTVIDEHHRGHLSLQNFVENSTSDEQQDRAERLLAQQNVLLELVNRPPGMKGFYHKLRVFARSQFLKPLELEIRTGNAAKAWERWQSYGNIEEMAEICVRALDKSGFIEATHKSQTCRYLLSFHAEIERWVGMVSKPVLNKTDTRELQAALLRLRRDANCHQPRHPSASLISTLDHISQKAGEADWLDADFGERCGEGGTVRIGPSTPSHLFSPEMLVSWPLVVTDEEVPLEALLHDRLRATLTPNAMSAPDVVAYYVRKRWFDIAERAALGDVRMEEFVRQGKERALKDFREQHSDTIAAAQEIREQDRDINECVLEVERAINSVEFEQAEDWISYLETSIAEFKQKLDPEFCYYREFLVEAGEKSAGDESLKEITARVVNLREQHALQRQHIRSLAQGANHAQLPQATINS